MRPIHGPIARGALVLVVGPSGAGKDSIINFARRQLFGHGQYVFARRLITRRDADPSEDHESCSVADFAAEDAAGKLVLSWRAHDTAYGIRRTILEDLGRGCVVVANVSRGVIVEGARLAETVVVAHVIASPTVLAERLRLRGRETEAEMSTRLARSAEALPSVGRLVTISNDGALAVGGQAFVALLIELGSSSGQGRAGNELEPLG